MRQWFLIPVACFAASVSVVLAQGAASAAATGKVDVQWKCTPPNPMNAVPVPDSADHAYIVESFNCTATKGEIGGVKQKSGTATDFMEATGNNAKGHGVFVETLANGDKITYTYTATGVSANKAMQSGTDKWTAASGTGKFKGIKASGTCTAKGAADGSVTFDCTGTYTMGAGK